MVIGSHENLLYICKWLRSIAERVFMEVDTGEMYKKYVFIVAMSVQPRYQQ